MEKETVQNQEAQEQRQVGYQISYEPPAANPVLVTRITGGVLSEANLLVLHLFSGAQLPVDQEGKAQTVVANLVASVLITPSQAEFLISVLQNFLSGKGDREKQP